MTVAPLSRLLTGARSADTPVAFRESEIPTLGRMRDEVAHNAARLRSRGVRHGLLAAEDAYAFAVGLFSLLHAGASATLPANTRPGTLAALAGDFDALVVDAPLIGVDALVLEAVGSDAALAPIDPGQARIDVFTSGSTGQPKRVSRPLARLEVEVAALERLLGDTAAGADFLATVSHQHVYGLTFALAWPLAAGRRFSAVVHDVWEGVIAALARPAVVVSSPAHLTRLAGLAALPPGHHPRMVLTAGAPLPPAAAEEATRYFGAAPVEFFGSSETGSFAWRQGTADPGLWRPLPGVTLSLGPTGLLRVASPFIDAPMIEPGDRAELAADGRFRFLGRVDGVVKIEGRRANLLEIERALAALPAVAEAAVVALGGRRPTLGAVVVPTVTGRAELDRLGRFRFARALRFALAATLEPAVLPRRWRFPASMPVDAMGKRRVADLASLFEAEVRRVRRRA